MIFFICGSAKVVNETTLSAAAVMHAHPDVVMAVLHLLPFMSCKHSLLNFVEFSPLSTTIGFSRISLRTVSYSR